MVFQTALSGIQASSKELDVIGNNIANSATVGFKKSRAEFADIYTFGAYGSGNTSIGNGVKLSRVQQAFGTGAQTVTGNSLDLAINGSGFFVLSHAGAKVYSRAGQFSLDKEGHIVNATQQRLQGLVADKFGTLSGASGDLVISKADLTPQATTRVDGGVNLQSISPIMAADWVGGATPATDTYNYTCNTTVIDSMGNSHILSMYYIKADSAALAGAPNAASPPGTENQWYVAFQIDNQNVPANVGPNNTDNLTRLNFNTDGTFAGAFDTTNTALAGSLIPLTFNLGNGSSPLNFTVDPTKCTQYSGISAPKALSSNGYTTGIIMGLEVDSSGTIIGRYTNGQSLTMGQIQIANFADEESLQNLGNTSWSETLASGQPLISAGLEDRISSGKLEESNVDLTSELVKLIGAQRNFQANAQTIRTGDAITQTIINIR